MVTATAPVAVSAIDLTVDPTAALLKRAVQDYQQAGRSGRDADLLRLRSWLTPLVSTGTAHDDLALTLLQVHLDAHALTAAEGVLRAYPRAAASAAGRSSRAVLAAQRGDDATADQIYRALIAEEPSWRHLAGLAGVFVDRGDVGIADALFAAAADDVDAPHLGALAWIELQRARLHRQQGDPARADFHLCRAELACPGWRTEEGRTRWLLAMGDPAAAVTLASGVARQTKRPDHQHLLGTALRAAGRDAEATVAYVGACAGYRRAARVWPSRYRHHLVHWHLEVDHDLDRALEEAVRDHAERPHRSTAALLAEVLAARTNTP